LPSAASGCRLKRAVPIHWQAPRSAPPRALRAPYVWSDRAGASSRIAWPCKIHPMSARAASDTRHSDAVSSIKPGTGSLVRLLWLAFSPSAPDRSQAADARRAGFGFRATVRRIGQHRCAANSPRRVVAPCNRTTPCRARRVRAKAGRWTASGSRNSMRPRYPAALRPGCSAPTTLFSASISASSRAMRSK